MGCILWGPLLGEGVGAVGMGSWARSSIVMCANWSSGVAMTSAGGVGDGGLAITDGYAVTG